MYVDLLGRDSFLLQFLHEQWPHIPLSDITLRLSIKMLDYIVYSAYYKCKTYKHQSTSLLCKGVSDKYVGWV